MFKHISMEALKDTKINWYGLVDPSWKGEYSDYAVIMIAGMDVGGEIYCRYIYRQKLTYAEIVVKMFEINAMYSPRQWLLETVATQKSIQYFLEQEQKRQTTFLRVKEIKGQRAQKEERIMALAPYYELGRAHHLRDCPQIEILESELMNFPRSKYDDVSDCWAGILEIATPPSGVVLSKEKSDKRKEYLKMLNKPKSPMVGY
jgi:predicted phage terminase large subunit-like protein